MTDLDIPITQELLLLIAEIDEFKGRWRALNTLAPDRLAALRKIATIESVGSSTRIEGARLTDRQVQALLANVGKQNFTSRDLAKEHGRVTTRSIEQATGESRSTIKARLKQLTNDRLLICYGNGRSTWYGLG